MTKRRGVTLIPMMRLMISKFVVASQSICPGLENHLPHDDASYPKICSQNNRIISVN